MQSKRNTFIMETLFSFSSYFMFKKKSYALPRSCTSLVFTFISPAFSCSVKIMACKPHHFHERLLKTVICVLWKNKNQQLLKNIFLKIITNKSNAKRNQTCLIIYTLVHLHFKQ